MSAGLPDVLASWSSSLASAVATVGVVVAAVGLVALLAVLPLLAYYYRVVRAYRAPARELKRAAAAHRAPVLSLFAEVSEGAGSVAALGYGARFAALNRARNDRWLSAHGAWVTVNRWLALRLELASASARPGLSRWTRTPCNQCTEIHPRLTRTRCPVA